MTGEAQSAVATAIRHGVLSRPTKCEACDAPQAPMGGGRPLVVYHHWSYEPANATDVIPLCRGCHAGVHGGIIAEPRTGRYYGPRVKPGRPTSADVHTVIRKMPSPFRLRDLPVPFPLRAHYLYRARQFGLVSRRPGERGWIYVVGVATGPVVPVSLPITTKEG